jgi:hypothetical protein
MSVVVEWVAADPSGLGIALGEALHLPRPDRGSDRLAFRLRGGDLMIVRGRFDRDDRIDRVEVVPETGGGRHEAGRDGSTAPDRGPGSGPARPVVPSPGAVSLLAVGFATVDLDRGLSETAHRFGLQRDDFRWAGEDGWLGARTRTAEHAGLALIVLEPSTEGRLAAALARHGEGPIAVYVGVPGPASRTTRPGPLGPAMLVHGPRAWGPFVLAIPDALVTIRGGGTIGG